MANSENLKKGKKIDSGELARRMGAEGGKKKAENDKKRKEEAIKIKSAKEALAGAMEIMIFKLSKEATDQKQKDMKDLLEACGNPLVAQLVNIIFNKTTAPLTKLKAIGMAFEQMGDKQQEIIKEIIYIDKEEKEANDKHIDEVINSGKD